MLLYQYNQLTSFYSRSNWLLNFRSDGLHVVALMSVRFRLFCPVFHRYKNNN